MEDMELVINLDKVQVPAMDLKATNCGLIKLYTLIINSYNLYLIVSLPGIAKCPKVYKF